MLRLAGFLLVGLSQPGEVEALQRRHWQAPFMVNSTSLAETRNFAYQRVFGEEMERVTRKICMRPQNEGAGAGAHAYVGGGAAYIAPSTYQR